MNQQNFAPSQTPPVPLHAYPQSQIPQHPMQSNEQLGQMQNNQAYNQLWQYYYYQQQQQQFLLQPQQQYQQHPQLLQVQQQFLHQQPLPYQQPQPLQLQQQPRQYLQQQQLQPLGSYQQQSPPPNHPLYLQQQQQEQEKRQGQITASQVQMQSDLSKEEPIMEPGRQATLQVHGMT